MPGTSDIGRLRTRCTLLFALFVFGGCTLQPPVPEPAPQPEVVVEPVVVEPVVEETPEPIVHPEPVVVPEPPQLPSVAIVVSGPQAAFLDVANALADRLENFEVYDLSDRSRPPASVLRGINDSDSGTIVAIGLRAAQSSVAMANAPVVFTQVFNYREHNLLTDNSRGIAPLAPLDAQLAAWREIDPELSSIGIIVGDGHDELIEEAQLAAQKHGVELTIHSSRSDQETLYFFRRMAQDIDGFWLFPDNRILSARSLREILEIAHRGQVAVAVPNEGMLALGASVSFETQPDDIAETIARIVRQIHEKGLQGIPPISPLSALRVISAGETRVVKR